MWLRKAVFPTEIHPELDTVDTLKKQKNTLKTTQNNCLSSFKNSGASNNKNKSRSDSAKWKWKIEKLVINFVQL